MFEQLFAGLPYGVPIKQSLFKRTRNPVWGASMWYCYTYMTFHVDPATGKTWEITIQDLSEFMPFKRRTVFRALQTLQDCGAIVKIPDSPNRYYLPDVAISSDRRTFTRRKNKATNPKNPITAYQEYLYSEEWRERRNAVMERDGWKCVVCGEEAQDVHHLTYERIFKEKLEDLIAVCRSCHSQLHSK